MPESRDAARVLDDDFLTTRHRLLDVAAALDRIGRSPNARSATDDARYGQIADALRILCDDEPAHAERVQILFSRPYDPNWNR